MKEPVDHIVRPGLPWRPVVDGAITECGLDAQQVRTITREQHVKRLKDYGQQRCAILTCMTCSQTSGRWESWAEDPRKAIGREVEWETGWRKDRGALLRDDLLAIADLIDAHQEEFRLLVTSARARRDWLERKRKEAPKRSRPMVYR